MSNYKIFKLVKPEITFLGIKWADEYPAENFSFSRCRIIFGGSTYDCWIYYPHPETKKLHFQSQFIIEIIAPPIPNIEYGSSIEFEYNPSEIVANNDQECGHILVLGDFMIDQAWVLSGLPSPSAQVHGQVIPMQRINPTWNDKRLGGAGMTLMALKTLCEMKNLNYHIHGIGLWNENDNELLQKLAGDEKITGGHETAGVKLHSLKVKKPSSNEATTEQKPEEIVTTIKSRFYTQLAQEELKLFSRFDQDPEFSRFDQDPEPNPENPPHQFDFFDNDLLQDIEKYFNEKNIQPQDIKAVIIADFNKGFIRKGVLEVLRKYLKPNMNVLWLIDSKNPEILGLLPNDQPVSILTMNREEAVKLSKAPEVFSIPKGNQPSIELLSVIHELAQKSNQIEKIVVKLDREGACLYVNQEGENTFIRQPEKPLESEGIAAGDFFNASLLLEYLSPSTSVNHSDNLHNACIDASKWLKFNQEYWANKKIREAYKSDVVEAKGLKLEKLRSEENKQKEVEEKINQVKNWDNREQFNLCGSIPRRSAA